MELDFEKEYQLFGDFWGLDAQLRMAVEEMSELTKEICKLIRYTNDKQIGGGEEKIKQIKADLQGEIADVLNCVDQLRCLFGKEQIDAIRAQKITRTVAKVEQLKKQEGDEQ